MPALISSCSSSSLSLTSVLVAAYVSPQALTVLAVAEGDGADVTLVDLVQKCRRRRAHGGASAWVSG